MQTMAASAFRVFGADFDGDMPTLDEAYDYASRFVAARATYDVDVVHWDGGDMDQAAFLEKTALVYDAPVKLAEPSSAVRRLTGSSLLKVAEAWVVGRFVVGVEWTTVVVVRVQPGTAREIARARLQQDEDAALRAARESLVEDLHLVAGLKGSDVAKIKAVFKQGTMLERARRARQLSEAAVRARIAWNKFEVTARDWAVAQADRTALSSFSAFYAHVWREHCTLGEDLTVRMPPADTAVPELYAAWAREQRGAAKTSGAKRALESPAAAIIKRRGPY